MSFEMIWGLIWFGIIILSIVSIVVLIIRRIKDKKSENFEDRDN